MNPVKDLNNMYFFARVVDLGGYSAAARAMGLHTSKLSRRIGDLEKDLGVRLLNRSSRRISLTEAGKTFHRHCLALVAEAQAAREAMNQTVASPRGTVRISCPLGLLHGGVSTILARYMTDYPQVRVALDATNRRVDVVDEGFDIALRVRLPPLEDSDLAMRSLAVSASVLVVSPELLFTHERPTDLAGLSQLPTLAMAGANDKYTWHFVRADGTQVSFTHRPRLATDDLATLQEAALRGTGVAQLPRRLVQADLARGALEQLLPELSSQAGIVHAVFPSRRGMVPAVRTLLDALSAGFADPATQAA